MAFSRSRVSFRKGGAYFSNAMFSIEGNSMVCGRDCVKFVRLSVPVTVLTVAIDKGAMFFAELAHIDDSDTLIQAII